MLDFGSSITVRKSTLTVMLSAPTRASSVPSCQPWHLPRQQLADPNQWISVPVMRVVEKSLKRNKRPDSERVIASTVVGQDTWLATAPTKRGTISVPPQCRWRSTRTSLRNRISTLLQIPLVVAAEEEIVVAVEMGARATQEILRPTAA